MNKFAVSLAAVLMSATSAYSADLYLEPAPEIPEVVSFGGWYLRGHLGMSNQRVKRLEHPGFDIVADHEFLDDGDFDSGIIGGIGVGYQVNDWLRTDAFVEYRGKTDFAALDRYWDPAGAGTWRTNDYEATKSEWLVMANVYADLGDYYGIVPYVGAGVGASRNTISNFRDFDATRPSVAYADEDSKWNLAWALHAGLGYQVNDRLTLDFGYSYLNLGDAQTGTIRTFDGTDTGERMKFEDITSHDFKLGLRYSLQ
ncbi:MAG TPA: outer membrane beta-barrel protein [Pseudorhizobium sp.]|jgi:opacity protein-like surface antigen|nr:outer membrane beta-barrel protein [Pseudorhizobium sp.]